MAHKNKVIRSINLPGDTVCLDLFQRPDASFGFETFRRDPEDATGWYATGRFSAQRFEGLEAALAAALRTVPWLRDAIDAQ